MTDLRPESTDRDTRVLTFVIADVRGYTRFTRERGDAAAAELARRFAEIARDAVEARGGRVIELRGDEALAVFGSPTQAVRAAVELQLTCAEETAVDAAFPFLVGVGIDTGAAVPVEDGYRGVALNLAARLCSAAGAGQVLLSTRTLEAADLPAERVRIEPREPMVFKGFDEPVDVLEATAVTAVARPGTTPAPPVVGVEAAGDPVPLVGRVGELRWLRGTWRQARRGNGRIVVVSGIEGIGKSRLATALTDHVMSSGGVVHQVAGGGTAVASALAALRDVRGSTTPALLVLDDVDPVSEDVAEAVLDGWPEIEQSAAMVVLLVRDTAASPALGMVVARADADGDGHRVLARLDADEVRELVGLYAGDAVTDAPVESIVRSSQGVPARVHELASEWARAEATRRLEAAAEFMAAVRDRRTEDLAFANNVIGLRLGRLFAVGGDGGLVGDDAECPYKGLAAFDEADAGWFFGRERLVGELAARLVGNGLVAVVGASGSGKSSVVRAGLLPSLASGLLPGSERWSACTMRPGEHPVEAARAALRTSADDPFAAAASDLPDGGRLIVVVDQFEEVFTTCASEAERSEFLDLLARAAARDVDRCCVVATMRSDFYGRLADHPQVAELFRDNHVLVGPLSRDELRRAITLPARRAGLAVEAALADALVAEAADGAGSLPLLSTALVELWQGRTDRWLRMPAYRESGGLEGAVARLAEASYAELSEVERAAARRVMLRLGTSGEGEVLTRRRVAVEEFDLELDPAAGRVIDRFTEDRLLTAEGDTIEVAHEALLRDWPRLEGWLSEDQQGRQLRQHVTQAARAWSAGGREPSELYRGARLTATLDWAAEHGGDLNELEREFLAASRQAADQDAQAQRRTNRRLRGLLAGVAVLLVLAVVAGVLATVQRSSAQSSARHARRQANRALAQSLGAQAVAQPRTDLAMLLALEAVRLDPSVQTRADLLTTLLRTPSALRGYHGNADRNNGLLLSPDGKSLAIVDNDHHWIWRDVATGRETRRNRDELLGFAPDGTLIDAGAAGSLVLRDPGSYEVIRTLAPPRAAHGDPAPADPGASLPWSARVLGSADGGHAVLVNYTHAHDHGRGADIDPGGDLVAAVRLSGGGPGRAFRVPPENTGLYPLRHGRQLLVVQPRSTYVVDAATGRRLRTYPVGADTAAVAPDSRTVALAHSTGALQLLDLRTGRLRQGIGAVDAARMLFTPDGRTLVVAGEDGVVQLWDVAAGDVRRTLAGHAGAIHGLAMSADGRTLYTGSFDTNVLSWDLTGSRGLVRSLSGGDADPVNGAWTLAVAPDNRTIAEGAADGDVVLTDLVTRRQLRRFHVADSGTDAAGVPVAGLVSAVSFSPDGRSLLVSGVQGPRSPTTKTWLEEWSVSGRPRLVRRFDTTDWPFLAWSAWSPDGRTVAAVGHLRNQDPLSAGAVGEWDAATGEPLAAPMRIKGGYGTVVAFAPHGTEIAVGGYGFQSFLADPARGAVLATLHGSGGPQQYQQGIAFSPDGSKVATAQFDGTLRIWRAADGRQLAKIQDAGQGVVEGVAWSPDGTMLAATDWEPSLRLYDVGTRQQVGPAYPLPALPDGLAFDPWVVFTPNGEDVVVSGTDDKTFVVPVTVAAWSRQACALAGRNLTRREWAHYVPGHAYERICPAA